MNMLPRFFLAVVLLCPALLVGGEEKSPRVPQWVSPLDARAGVPRTTSAEEQSLLGRMMAARESGQEELFNALHAELMEYRGIVAGSVPVPFDATPVQIGTIPEVDDPDLWGGDVLVYSGVLLGAPPRRILTRTADDGTIFAGYIYQSGSNAVYFVRKSTNNGATWTSVSGAQVSGRNVRGFAFDVADTTGGFIVGALISVAIGNNLDGTLYWVSFHEDGSGFRSTALAGGGANVGYAYPTLISDAFNYSPGITWWYGATSLVDSNGIANMLLAWRTTNWGVSWIRDTVRTSWDDIKPAIEFQPMGTDSVYIAFQYRPSSSSTWDVRLAKTGIAYGGTTSDWPIVFLTTDTLDQIDVDLTVGRGDGDVVLTYTDPYPPDPADLDIAYFYSADSGRTINGPSYAFSTGRAERFGSIDIFRAAGATPFYRAVCLDADTSIHTRTGASITAIGSAVRTAINQFSPSTSVTPDVGSHSAAENGTHVIYAGFGPTNLYYDGADVTVGVKDGESLPGTFGLSQNYPNPFNPSTKVRFTIPSSGHVSLRVFNVLGQEVATVVDGLLAGGAHEVNIDAGGLPTGVYFYTLATGDRLETRKMMLLR